MPKGVFIRKLRPLMERFEEKYIPEPMSGCYLWTAALKPNGYGMFIVDGRREQRARSPQYAHRAAWALHKGEIPRGLNVLHNCDNRACVNPDHLFLGTQQDNVDDMYKKGRANRPFGERSPSAKLTDAQVIMVRQSKLSNKELASQLGIDASCISRIKSSHNWKHVGG